MNFIIFKYRHLCVLYIHNQLATLASTIYIILFGPPKIRKYSCEIIQVSDFKFNLKRYMVPLCLTKMHMIRNKKHFI